MSPQKPEVNVRHRMSHAQAILGPELYGRLPNTKVLLVGAGGIGCELRACAVRFIVHPSVPVILFAFIFRTGWRHILLAPSLSVLCVLCLLTPQFRTCAVKNIVLTGFGHITLLDLDTIDLSNLNRQFLFKKKDVKQSKALVHIILPSPVIFPVPPPHLFPVS